MRSKQKVLRWKRHAALMVATIHRTQADLIADVGEPAVVVLAACDQLDQSIADLRRWMLDHPSPEPELDLCLSSLVRACSGLGTMMTTVARLAPAGIDTEVHHLPASFAQYMEGQVDALADAWAEVRRLELVGPS